MSEDPVSPMAWRSWLSSGRSLVAWSRPQRPASISANGTTSGGPSAWLAGFVLLFAHPFLGDADIVPWLEGLHRHWRQVLLEPELTGDWPCIYPVIPWLAVFLMGLGWGKGLVVDRERALRQWGELLEGEVETDDGNELTFRWPESALRVRVMIDADSADRSEAIEIAAPANPIEQTPHPLLGARFDVLEIDSK